MTKEQEAQFREFGPLTRLDKHFVVPFGQGRSGRGGGLREYHLDFNMGAECSFSWEPESATPVTWLLLSPRKKLSKLEVWALQHSGARLFTPRDYCMLPTEQQEPAQSEEVRTAMLELARTKAALAFSDSLYQKRKADTGLTSAQQYLAAKQAQRGRQS